MARASSPTRSGFPDCWSRARIRWSRPRRDFKDHGVEVPLLVGGAALSEQFTTTRIGPAYASPTFYAKDAMTGLRIMNELMDPATREVVMQHAHFYDRALPPPRGSGRRWSNSAPRAAPKFAPIFRFPPRPISTAACARSRI